MDLAELFVNVGLLLISAVAAAVAWWQAAQARRSGNDAQAASADAAEARRRAVEAQQNAAQALTEANEIARAAKAAVDDQLALERRRDERLVERRDVSWSAQWLIKVDADQPPTLELTNTGTTAAEKVTLTMDVPQGRQVFELGNIRADDAAHAQVQRTEGRGPLAAAVLARRAVPIDIHWQSPAGHPSRFQSTVWDPELRNQS
ncbi:hypothetical protein AB0230_07005 [Microbacterium sp. NPDC089190]|uniref:hypothetical protein n=1 Tax=Microbacterium sp. NPDC089190 TaxID=3155063 RepID=UPI00344F1FB8